MVYYCCVPLCTSKSSCSLMSFHTFTKNKKLQQIWIHRIRRDTRKSKWNKKPFSVNVHTKICSKHFLKTDFIIRSPTRKVLKKTAIPSVFPWSTKSERKSVLERSSAYKKLDSLTKPNYQNVDKSQINDENVVSDNPQKTLESNVIEETVPEVFSEAILDKVDYPTEKDTTQTTEPTFNYRQMYFDLLVEYNDFKKGIIQHPKPDSSPSITKNEEIYSDFVVERFKNDPKKFCYYTGFPNYNIFTLSFGVLFENAKIRNIKMNYSKSEKNIAMKLSPENQYFLTLVKLRQNFGFEHLSTLFKISVSSVSCIFSSWVNFLYLRLGSLDIWPHRDILLQTYLPDFCNKYPNVIGFIDATEFYIQTPSSLVRQSQTYSQYKSHNTLKGLVVTDANGTILFISALFTGSISDNELLLQSGFVNILKEKLQSGYLSAGDIFLADKGFRTKDLLQNVDININIPVFRITGMQFTPDEVAVTRTIAHERIHVERAINRIKSFKILSHEAPITLMGSFNQICTVCALLTNFRLPLRVS